MGSMTGDVRVFVNGRGTWERVTWIGQWPEQSSIAPFRSHVTGRPMHVFVREYSAAGGTRWAWCALQEDGPGVPFMGGFSSKDAAECAGAEDLTSRGLKPYSA